MGKFFGYAKQKGVSASRYEVGCSSFKKDPRLIQRGIDFLDFFKFFGPVYPRGFSKGGANFFFKIFPREKKKGVVFSNFSFNGYLGFSGFPVMGGKKGKF